MKKIFLLLVLGGMINAFSVEAKLQSPELISPCNNPTVTSLVPELHWNVVGGAAKVWYKWEVLSEKGDWIDGRLAAQSQNQATIKPNALEPDKNYKWRARAKDVAGFGGESDWSGWCAFNTGMLQPPPPAPPGEPTISGLNPDYGLLGTSIKITGNNFACATYPAGKKNIITFTGDNNQVIRDESPKCESLYTLISVIPANFPKTVKTITVQVQVDNKISNQKGFSVRETAPPRTTPPAWWIPKFQQYEPLDWPDTPMRTPMPIDNLAMLIRYFYEWAIALGGLAVFIVLIYAGFRYLTSVGDPGKTRDAMDSIKSAVFGLILLLSSYLILNTINPQLVTLRLPDTQKITGELWSVPSPFLEENEQPCKYVELYSSTNYSDLSPRRISRGEPLPNLNMRVGSVKIAENEKFGNCLLTLFRLQGYETNSDKGSIPITRSVRDVGGIYNVDTYFQSAKVTDVSNK